MIGIVKGVDLIPTICESLGIDPLDVAGMNIEIPIDGIVVVEVKFFPREPKCNSMVEQIKRYRLEEIG